MIQKIVKKAFLCLCGTMLVSSMVCGEENTEKVPVGTRALSSEEHISHQEMRAKLAVANQAEEGKTPDQISDANQDEASALVMQHAVSYTSHPGAYHSLDTIDLFGYSVGLEDGSVWSVSSGDAYKTSNWLPNDVIVITPNHSLFSSYNFRLTNQNTGVSVASNLIIGPFYNAPFTHWIVAIDYIGNMVYLEDGTVWNMSYYDDNIVCKWMINDTVIIGINDGWLSSGSKPNILINVNMLNYAAGMAY